MEIPINHFNWHRNILSEPNPRTFVKRIVRPLRLCRHTHQHLTSIDPKLRFGVVNYFRLGEHNWVVLKRSMNWGSK